MKYLWLLLLSTSLWGQAIPVQFFGMHDNKTNNWPPLPFGAIREWDTATQWGKIETSAGVYSFSHLDAYIAEAQAHGADILFTVAMTPTFYSSHSTDSTCAYGVGWCWAPTDVDSGNTHFQNFVIALINHVGPGVIKYYEGWNEPNNPPTWKDTVAHLKIMQATLFNTVRARDPSALVLMPPSFHSYIPTMLSAGIGAFADINTFHGKKCIPEDDVANTNTIKADYSNAGLGSRPLWNTEGGWGNTTNCTDSANYPAKVARLYLLNRSQGIGRYYWYAYDNTSWGTLGSGQTLNTSGVAYKQVSNWMVGASGGTCTVSGTLWTCIFTRTSPPGYQSRAIWTTGATTSITVPPGFTTERTLTGAVIAITPGSSISISGSPVLIESTTAPPAPNPPTGLTAVVH